MNSNWMSVDIHVSMNQYYLMWFIKDLTKYELIILVRHGDVSLVVRCEL